MSILKNIFKRPFNSPVTKKAITFHINIKDFTPKQFDSLKTYINTLEDTDKTVRWCELTLDKNLKQNEVNEWDETKVSLKLNTVKNIKDFVNNNYKED